MRNVEIKARARDLARLRRLAGQLSGSDGQQLRMSDVFFRVPHGRLKLRRRDDTGFELIHYERPDTPGPGLSTFTRVPLDELAGGQVRQVLSNALHVRGNVDKLRWLYMVDRTRVHVDSVQGLGDFVELEVQLTDEETVEDGQLVAHKLMQQLEISESDLLDCAYIDMLEKMANEK